WLALAQSAAGETRIEVDENGDEYELKRFYIQGRQLNGAGSKSQCVVTRRKRASRQLTLPAAGLSVSSQQLSLSALADGTPEHREAAAAAGALQTDGSHRRYVALTALQLENADEEEEDDDDEEEDDDEEDDALQNDDDEDEGDEEAVEELPQLVQLQPQPVKQPAAQTNLLAATFGSQSAIAATATHNLPQGVSVLANAATHANVGGDAGIVVIESEQPPKVNPSTHALFELKPLQQQQQQQALQQPQQLEPLYWPQDVRDFVDEVDDDAEDDELFYYGPGGVAGYYDEHDHFVTEDSPVSTTAIWSTDNSDIHPVNNGVNQHVDENKKKQKQKRRKPGQEMVVKRKQQQQKKKRPSQQLDEQQPVKETSQKRKKQSQSNAVRRKPASSSSSGVSSGNKRKRPSSSAGGVSNKRKTSTSQRQKPQKKNKKTRKPKPSSGVSNSNSNSNKRRRPSSSSASASAIGGYKRRRPQSSTATGALTQAQRRRRKQQQQEKRRRQELQRRRRRRNKNRQNGGGNRRRYYGDEPIINCIYINKDPPTTTQRPFWNILGRDAAAPADAGDATAPIAPVEESEMRQSGDFGHRKRTNLRFVA
ncbi:hypothetical protein KR093_004522, partial [Drosophila rubida]